MGLRKIRNDEMNAFEILKQVGVVGAHIASLVAVLRLGDILLVKILDLLVVIAAKDSGVDTAYLVLVIKND